MTPQEIDKTLTAALITVAVAAVILAVTQKHVYELIQAGKLQAVDVGTGSRSSYRVKSGSVRRLLGDLA